MDLQDQIVQFGRDIFGRIGNAQPSPFSKQFWSNKIMGWAIKKPEFKTNLFRLVDVLPTLKTSDAIADHITQYLYQGGNEIHPALGWALEVSPGTVKSKFAAFMVKRVVKEIANQFIVGSDPKQALSALRKIRRKGMAFTADLLGEYCVSEKEALVFYHRYLDALGILGKEVVRWPESKQILDGHPGEQSPVCISIKLTALYSQCSSLNFNRSVETLSERLASLVKKAKEVDTMIYVDAEDSSNNPIIYESFKNVFLRKEFLDFPYPGIVVQAYARSALETCRDLISFAKKRGAPIAIRLVKGAYWDSETIGAAQNEWASPLFTVKESSDANYERLSRLLLDNNDHILPAFGSHNIRSLCHACCYAMSKGLTNRAFELQMLYGMADPIADAYSQQGYLVRFYAPVGEMLPGMGYLVRRLLENTSNESFLKHTFFDAQDVQRLLEEPVFRD